MHTETHFPHSQQHTVLAVYLVGLCAALTATYDSTQVGRGRAGCLAVSERPWTVQSYEAPRSACRKSSNGITSTRSGGISMVRAGESVKWPPQSHSPCYLIP